jgi:hypothetical protein
MKRLLNGVSLALVGGAPHRMSMRTVLRMTALLGVMGCNAAFGQVAPVILQIDVNNFVQYQGDIADPARFATSPSITPSVQPRNFFVVTSLGDIVAVNGQPARGTVVARVRAIRMNPDGPAAMGGPGAAIGDIHHDSIREQIFEILKSDGTEVGTIMALGLGGTGDPPPGAPLVVTGSNFAIIGGTGAFLGARGQFGMSPFTGPTPRSASMAEDPSYRRVNGGGVQRYVLHLIPMFVPQIAVTGLGPAVAHSKDFTLVSPSSPATAGEVLALFVSGLGPTRPGVDPGQPFLRSPLAAVNSPVGITVNGKEAEVLAAVGYPGATDGYQVNFRIPSDVAKGMNAIQLSAAWVAGPPVSIPIQ